jgi:lipoprotein-releasing system permease protein
VSARQDLKFCYLAFSPMPYEVFLALRYLRSSHRRRLGRITAIAAMLGIAMGVAALVVAFALSNGFRDEMRNKILQGTAHLSLLRSDGQPISDGKLPTRVTQIDGIKHASLTSYDGGVARGAKGSTYAVLRGIESSQATELTPWLSEGAFAELFNKSTTVPEAVVGVDLATRIGLSTGDYFQIIPANATNLQSRRLRVAGTFKSGLFEYDSTWIYVSRETATTFAGAGHTASVVSAQVNDVDDVKRVAERLRESLGAEYTVVDWQQANQPLFAALALERRMGLFIIGLIIALAALNIATMLILVVSERRRDIAILGAMGATSRSITLLFVIEGTMVGAIGAVTGVTIGLAACFAGNFFKLVSLPADVYSISNVPLNAGIRETAWAAVIAFTLSVLATIYPARAAASMRPIETLRDAG